MLELWAGERAVAALPLARRGAARPDAQGARADRGRRVRDHQGVVAWAAPYPYADAWELAAVERPLLACLDQVTDPRNLGAVVRSALGRRRNRRDRARRTAPRG